MTQRQTIKVHRRADGTINIDFYRAEALRLRGEAFRDAFKLKGAAVKFALATVVATLAIIAIRPM